LFSSGSFSEHRSPSLIFLEFLIKLSPMIFMFYTKL
jgi:hypothetical protein